MTIYSKCSRNSWAWASVTTASVLAKRVGSLHPPLSHSVKDGTLPPFHKNQGQHTEPDGLSDLTAATVQQVQLNVVKLPFSSTQNVS